MHYYKYIDESENVFQYEETNRIINSPMVVEITKEEYDADIAALPTYTETDIPIEEQEQEK